MSAQVKDLIGSDIWLNQLIKDPDRDVYEREKGERDRDPDNIKPGFIPKPKRKKGGRHV
jgi:hypothetical protein